LIASARARSLLDLFGRVQKERFWFFRRAARCAISMKLIFRDTIGRSNSLKKDIITYPST
jgi:hypothetical protein